MRRIVRMAVCLILLLSLMLPQAAFAAVVDASDPDEGSPAIAFWGGSEPTGDTSIKVSWISLKAYKGFIVSWKEEGKKSNTGSVTLHEPSSSFSVTLDEFPDVTAAGYSHEITGLDPKKEYRVVVKGIVRENENGDLVCTFGIGRSGNVTYAAAPEYQSRESTGASIESFWKVQSQNSVLKIYRATSKGGSYKLVGTVDGSGSDKEKLQKDANQIVSFKDTDVAPGKTYYYKAKTELKVGEKVQESAFSRVVTLAAKNKSNPQYAAKLKNRLGTYAKKLTWKITSDAANYKTVVKKNAKMFSVSAGGKDFQRKVTNVEYSFNGKKFYKLQKALTIKPGKTVYLRLTLDQKLWIRKDGKGHAYLTSDYYYAPPNMYINGVKQKYVVKGISLNVNSTAEVQSDDPGGDLMEFPYSFFARY